ncbi:MAG TPA: HTTM domain-containing protein, partial [Nannocystis sp.]
MDSPVSASAVTRREPCPGPAEAGWSAAALSGVRDAGASLARRLFAPVDIASLVWFRVAFGLLLLVEVLRHADTIAPTYIRPAFHFTYYGFDWIRPWPGDGMYLHFAVLGLAAACLAVGFCYRLAAAVCFLGLGYWFLLEQARYQSYFYLLTLLGFLMIFVPAHRAFSIDAWRDRELAARTVPAWALWLLRAQIAVPFVFAGLARLNGDWLRGEPVRMWLAARADWPLVGSLFTREWAVYLFSYGELLFDLLVVPALLWQRTRPYAFAAALLLALVHSAVF